MSENNTTLPPGLTLKESCEELTVAHKPVVASWILVAFAAAAVLAAALAVDWFAASVRSGMLAKILLDATLLMLGLALTVFAGYSVVARKVNTDRCSLDRASLRRRTTPLSLFGDAERKTPVAAVERLYVKRRFFRLGVELGYVDKQTHAEHRLLLVPQERGALHLKHRMERFLARCGPAPENTDR